MILKANGKDITALTGNMTLNSSIDNLGDQLDFEIAYSKMKLYPNVEVNVGDLIQLFGDKEVFRGIVVEKTRNENTQSFACFDFAFYLNKSKAIKQFNNIRADQAIKSLLSDFKVPVGSIESMPIVIDRIYHDKEISEIIKDIIEQTTKATGVRYVMEMNGGKLYIYKDADLDLNLKVKLATNLASSDIGSSIGNPSKRSSIDEMKNSIKLYINNDEKIKIIAEVKNDALIKKYGLLQETQTLEDKDIAKAKNIAQNMLNELGKVLVEGSIDVIGNFDLRAGRILELNEPITNIVGRYKIKSVSHSISNIHTASLDLVEV